MENALAEQLKSLNPQQLEAVTTTEGPLLVIAGAGSGKTRVLTLRIAYLLSKGVNPYSILALTFTNKAAREMKDRIATMTTPKQAQTLWMGTFHSIFLRMLREHAQSIGYDSNFSIYDTNNSSTLLKRIIKEMVPKDSQDNYKHILARISLAKNKLILPTRYQEDPQIQAQDRVKWPLTGAIYARYQQELLNAQAMDFDDILVNIYRLLQQHEEILTQFQKQFSYIMVDEYQDTNFVQSLIIRLLAAGHHNLCVVGDDAQSIYSFRGADLQHILKFPSFFPNVRTIKLTMNYRSLPTIVSAANRLIAHNQRQIPKECRAFEQNGGSIRFFQHFSAMEEATSVAADIKELSLKKRLRPDQFAILYRTNAQSRLFEVALRGQDIPYRVYGGPSFFERKEIQDMLAYCKVLANPSDSVALLRIINFPPRQIGDKTLSTLSELAKAKDISLWNALESLEQLPMSLSQSAKASLWNFRTLMQKLISLVNSTSASEVILAIYKDSGLEAHYMKEDTVENESRRDNIHELIEDVKNFEDSLLETGEHELVTLNMYLDNVSLRTDLDQEDNAERGAVTLTTIHSAKGLEYDYVYVVGMAQEIFPSRRAMNERNGLEEERRLCYVAITRAAKGLVLAYASDYMREGRTQSFNPSQFLGEIDPQYAESLSKDTGLHNRIPRARMSQSFAQEGTRTATPRLRRLPNSPSAQSSPNTETYHLKERNTAYDFAVNDRVLHQKFGVGVIQKITGEGQDARAEVQFRVMGTKTLMLAYAKLKKLD